MGAYIVEFAHESGENQYMALVAYDDLFNRDEWDALKRGEVVPYDTAEDGTVLVAVSIVDNLTIWHNEATVGKGEKVV